MKISMIIPTYNVEKYVVQCVKSVCEQTYKDIEVLVIDNESKDSTFRILQKMQKTYKFKLDTAENIWPYCWDECRNKGMSYMTGEWFTVIGSDDYIEIDYVEKAANFIKANKNVLALQSPMQGFQMDKQTGQLQHSYSSIEEFKNLCLNKSPVNTPTVFYHRSLYDKGLANGKPELYSGAADYNLYCELADANVLIHPVPEWIGYHYRWHENQATWGMHKTNIKYDNVIQNYWRKKWLTNP